MPQLRRHANDTGAGLSLTNSLDVITVLDHFDGDVVVVDTRSGRVDTGEPGAVGAAGRIVLGIIIVQAGFLAGTRTTVSAIVALKEKATNDKCGAQVRWETQCGGRHSRETYRRRLPRRGVR